MALQKVVIPLKKGIHAFLTMRKEWIPTIMGMTLRFFRDFLQRLHPGQQRRSTHARPSWLMLSRSTGRCRNPRADRFRRSGKKNRRTSLHGEALVDGATH